MRGNPHLKGLEHKVAAIMASTERFAPLSLATVLSGGAYIYGTAMRLRDSLYQKGLLPQYKLSCPVISIGNLVVGGSGKTPLAIHLARLLQQMGLRAMIVSRGYRGEGERDGILVSDGRAILCHGRQAGDEPFLMATLLGSVPVVVGRDRWAAGHDGLARFKPDVILLDDAFQHQRLARDLNLVLMDFKAPLGNGHLLPRGPLREPVSALNRADAIIFTRCEGSKSSQYLSVVQTIYPRPFFHARHLPVMRCIVPAGEMLSSEKLCVPIKKPLSDLGGQALFAFAGLARNQEFFATIGRLGGNLLDTMGFTDHHPYQTGELEQIAAAARRKGCNAIVTSDKDFVRLPAMAMPLDLIVLGIDIDFGIDAPHWQRFIAEKIAAAGGTP
jgi:tetraacyldisaccharide 4'-kinase